MYNQPLMHSAPATQERNAHPRLRWRAALTAVALAWAFSLAVLAMLTLFVYSALPGASSSLVAAGLLMLPAAQCLLSLALSTHLPRASRRVVLLAETLPWTAAVSAIWILAT